MDSSSVEIIIEFTDGIDGLGVQFGSVELVNEDGINNFTLQFTYSDGSTSNVLVCIQWCNEL